MHIFTSFCSSWTYSVKCLPPQNIASGLHKSMNTLGAGMKLAGINSQWSFLPPIPLPMMTARHADQPTMTCYACALLSSYSSNSHISAWEIPSLFDEGVGRNIHIFSEGKWCAPIEQQLWEQKTICPSLCPFFSALLSKGITWAMFISPVKYKLFKVRDQRT